LSVVHGRVLQNAVTQIQDVAVTTKLGDDVQSGLADFLLRAEKNCWIEIALDSDARTGKRAKFAEWNAPIDAKDIGADFDDGPEKVVRGLCVINHGDNVAEARNDFLNGGKSEFGVVVEIEFTAPGVEELDSGDASGDLAFEIKNCGFGDFLEKCAENFGLGVEEIFYGGEAFLGAAFDHVAGEGPGRSGETENGDIRAGIANGAAKRFHQEAGFDFGIEDAEFFYIGFGANGFGEIGALVLKFESKSHRLGGDEDVRKNDDGINAESAERLHGDFERQIRGLADFEEGMPGADFAIFGKVAASLAHHPDGQARNGFTAASAEEEFCAGWSRSLGSHR
jgi:hypothetical protein